MELLKSWLSAKRGRAVRLAAHLHVPPSFVAKMASGGKPIPVEHAAGIEEFTGGIVSRKLLFPRDWRRIWPELDDADSGADPALSHQAPAAINSEARQAVQEVA